MLANGSSIQKLASRHPASRPSLFPTRGGACVQRAGSCLAPRVEGSQGGLPWEGHSTGPLWFSEKRHELYQGDFISVPRTEGFPGTRALNAKTKMSPANQNKLVTIVPSLPWPWRGLNH